MLSELFSMCLRESYFPVCCKVSSLLCSLYLRMLGRDMQLKASTLLVFFEKLVNDRLVDHIKKYGLFIDFWY